MTTALDALVDRAPAAVERGRPRLWVDRSFTIKGAGTVVTGTLGGGSLAVGDDLDALDRHGRPHRVHVRGLHSQESARVSVGPGQRVAVNVTGVHHDALGRGAVLVRSAQWRPTTRIDGLVRVLPGAEIGNRGALLAYFGTTEQPVRLRLLEGRDRLGPGEQGSARLWLRQRVPLLPGDRFVLRDTGRAKTVAGGEVLDVQPMLPVSRARPDRSTQRVVAERGWVATDELEAITGERIEATVGHWVASPAAMTETRARIEAIVDAAGGLGADVAALDEHARGVLPSIDGLVVDRGRLRRAGSADGLDDHPWLNALRALPFAPPPSDDIPRAEVRELVRRGVVVEEDTFFFALDAIEQARRLVVDALAAQPTGITMSELRELLGTSRKFAVPIATVLDRRGVTVRRDDVRVAGRRADQPVRPEPT